MEFLWNILVILIGETLTVLLFFGLTIFGIITLIRSHIKKEKQKKEEYENGEYFKITHTQYNQRFEDLGKTGEYLIYEQLKHREATGAKFLFNVYVPKKNGNTSEIDAIMIDQHGIFVFESKNYSGWIFGDENSKQWCQCLRSGRYDSQKEYFYNPIMQNSGHIKSLRSYFAQYKISKEKIPMHNVVVFSDRCDLKGDLSSNQCVTYRCRVDKKVNEICASNSVCLNEEQIEWIYQKLYPFTQVSDDVKTQHIEQNPNL